MSRVDPPDVPEADGHLYWCDEAGCYPSCPMRLCECGGGHTVVDGNEGHNPFCPAAPRNRAAAPLPPDTPEPCPECGVAPNEPHAEGCFFLTGDPNDLRPAVLRVSHSDRKAGA